MKNDRTELTALLSNKKVCLVTDWLTNIGGAEKVLHAVAELFPQAPILTTVHNFSQVQSLFPDKNRVQTSYLQKFVGLRHRHQLLLPLLSNAIERHDLRDYDLIISFSSCIAKNVQKHRKDQLHVCYIHTPMRYAWEPSLDPRVAALPWFARGAASRMMESIRKYDKLCSARPDYYISNSSATAAKVKQYYNRSSSILYPPFDPPPDSDHRMRGDYYFAMGRHVSYKRFDLLIEYFTTEPEKKLTIAGDGPDNARLQRLASKSRNIEFLGRISEQEKFELFSGAKAFLLPQQEDAGIVQLEAMGCGTPVIAYGAGGALDVISEGTNGVLFHSQDIKSLGTAIERFESAVPLNPSAVRESVDGYKRCSFQEKFANLLTEYSN